MKPRRLQSATILSIVTTSFVARFAHTSAPRLRLGQTGYRVGACSSAGYSAWRSFLRSSGSVRGELFAPTESCCRDRHGATVTRFQIQSKYLGKSIEEIIVAPNGGGAGTTGTHASAREKRLTPSSFLTKYWYDALAMLGRRAPDLLLVNGGESSYYHDRADGRWGSYVIREVIPAGIKKLRADGSRIAIGGISMGGFGALRLGLQSPGRFCAVGGHSPALWRTGGETPEGAFDNAEDFARNNIIALAGARSSPSAAHASGSTSAIKTRSSRPTASWLGFSVSMARRSPSTSGRARTPAHTGTGTSIDIYASIAPLSRAASRLR